MGEIDSSHRRRVGRRPHLVLCLLLVASLAVALAATPASGDRFDELAFHERCFYRQGGPPGPEGDSLHVVSPEGIGFARHGQRIRVYTAGVRCRGPVPTVRNIDEIVVDGAIEGGGLYINESSGRFAPGAGGDGIKFRVRGPRVTVLGTRGRDHIVVGTSDGVTAIDLDAEAGKPRYDIFMLEGRPELVAVGGGGGDDLLDARPLRGMSSHRDRRHRLKLNGGGGDDTILGSRGGDWRLVDGPGDDLVRGGAGNDTIWFDGGHDTLIGGPGNDEISYMAYEGSYLPPDPTDRIFAGPGRDLVADQNRHRDLLDCGPGLDMVVHERHDRPDANCERKW